MNKLLVSLLVMGLLGGCANVRSVPELQHRAAWMGLPVRQVIEDFGVPHTVSHLPDKQWVVLSYSYDTSFMTRQALGTHTGPVNGQLVHVEYWGDVKTVTSCTVRFSINRARQVADFQTTGGRCGAVAATPSSKH